MAMMKIMMLLMLTVTMIFMRKKILARTMQEHINLILVLMQLSPQGPSQMHCFFLFFDFVLQSSSEEQLFLHRWFGSVRFGQSVAAILDTNS